ncbi:MAG: hypothetical protein ABR529_04905 [Actinomycetota bacterium]
MIPSAENERAGKPDPAAYVTTPARLGVAVDRCIAVKTRPRESAPPSLRRDLHPRRQACGETCIAVPEVGPVDDGHGADLVLGSLTELDESVWDALRRAG